MKDPRDIQRKLRQHGSRFAALRELKLLLRTAQACSGPQTSALYNCVHYVASHDHSFLDPDAKEVMQLASEYQGFTAGQRAKVAEWLRSGRPPHVEHEREDERWFVPYDGPDDVERYEGHGEWDTSAGYWVG